MTAIQIEPTPQTASAMKLVAVYASNGMLISVAQVPPEVPDESLALPGCYTMPGNADAFGNPSAWRVDLSGDSPRLVPRDVVTAPASGRWQMVDVHTGTVTEAGRADVLEDISSLVSAAMKSRAAAPIDVAGVTYDADTTAQNNIKAKLLEITSLRRLNKSIPPELLVWRDFHNITHTFDSMDALEIMLSDVAAAIAHRGTELYIWSWEVKTQAAALESLQEIAQYLESQNIRL